MAFTAVTFSLFSSNTRVKQLDALAQAKDDIGKDISNRVRWSTNITVGPSNDRLDVTSTEGQEFHYEIRNGILVKNDVPLHSDQYEVTRFVVHDYGAGNLAGIEVEITLRRKSFTALVDTLKLVASQRQTEIILED